MAFTERGRIYFLSEIRSGISKSGKQWQSQTIVLDVTYGNYSKKFALDVTGDELKDLKGYKVGDDVEVDFFVGSREWQGKWYTSADLVGIRSTSAAGPASNQQPEDNDWGGSGADDLPFD